MGWDGSVNFFIVKSKNISFFLPTRDMLGHTGHVSVVVYVGAIQRSCSFLPCQQHQLHMAISISKGELGCRPNAKSYSLAKCFTIILKVQCKCTYVGIPWGSDICILLPIVTAQNWIAQRGVAKATGVNNPLYNPKTPFKGRANITVTWFAKWLTWLTRYYVVM